MTRYLAVAWAMHRMARSVPLAVAALLVMAALCIAIAVERQAVQREAETLAQTAQQAVAVNPIADHDKALITAWRQRLTLEAGRLPPRKDASAIVRGATGILEASGVSIESVNTSHAAFSATPYEALTLEARMTGSAVRAAAVMSEILADSPGWSIERLSIERQAEGLASIEAVLVLVHGSTQ